MTFSMVAMKPDSTSVSPSSARSVGSAGGTLQMYAPATSPPANTAQTADQRVAEGLSKRPAQAAVTGSLNSRMRCSQSAGPARCTELPLASTATVTGMSRTSNS